jgi:toxin ParE1/3/4
MRHKVRRSAATKRDQRDIWWYIAERNVTAADATIDRLDEVISMLAEYPDAGRSRSDLSTEVRYFPVEHYLVFYRFRENVIDVLRILHAARDITPEMLFE